jgi:hypothetical protein
MWHIVFFWALLSFPEAFYFFSVVSSDELLKGVRGNPDENPLILLWWVVRAFLSYQTFDLQLTGAHFLLLTRSHLKVLGVWCVTRSKLHTADPQRGATIQSSWQPGAWDLFPLVAPPVTWKYHTYSSPLWVNFLQPEEVLKLPLCFVGGTSINFTFMGPCIVLMYVVGSISFRPDIQKPRQMENGARDI